MPERLYLFDVDGTLTEPRQHIDPEIEEIIMEWILSGDKKVYLVTGSDVSKTSEQLGEDFMDACFGCLFRRLHLLRQCV
jgi:hydroxymethylpyrimidine pyrophosphatase-like HAD family hydrolase